MASPFRALLRVTRITWVFSIRLLKNIVQFVQHLVIPGMCFVDYFLGQVIVQDNAWIDRVHLLPSL